MGIQDLYSVLDVICPDALRKISFDQLSGWSVAVDISIFFYKFARSSEGEGWVDLFLAFLTKLKQYRIGFICVFDGPNPPPEKKFEQERRRAETAKQVQKLELTKKYLTQVTEIIEDGKVLPDSLVETIKICLSSTKNPSKQGTGVWNNKYHIKALLESQVTKLTKQTTPITEEHKNKAIEVVNYLGVPYCVSPGEAETLCCALALAGRVDAVMTEDTDVLAYGVPAMVSKIDTRENTACWISHAAIQEDSGYSIEEFRDLCILLSCDYNDRVVGLPPESCSKHDKHTKRKKPVSIGAKAAVCMIDIHRRLEAVEPHLVDSSLLNYVRCRELFTVPDYDFDQLFGQAREPDLKGLAKFLERNNIRRSDWIMQTWK